MDSLEAEWIKRHIRKMQPFMEKTEFDPNMDCLSLNEIIERIELDYKLLERWRKKHPDMGDT